MKKILLILGVCLLPLSGVYAQEEKKQYLPEAGDISISFSLNPVLRYVGNMFNNATDNTLGNLGGVPATSEIEDWNANINPDVSIMGKYMLTDEIGLRANIGLITRHNKNNVYVRDDKAVALNPFDESKLVDSRRTDNTGLTVMLGGEYRLGKRRVQGVFGAGLIVGYKSTATTYTYANQITPINQNPTDGFNAKTSNDYKYRILTNKSGRDVITGLTCSAGIDWFVAPKIALGAEVNLTGYYLIGSQQYQISEGYNSSTKKVEQRTDLVSPGDNTWYIGTDNIGGSMYISFYF